MQPMLIIERVPVSANVEALFVAYMHRVKMRMEGVGTVLTHVLQYERRVDIEDWPIPVPGNECLKMPPQWHACMAAASKLLRHIDKEKLVYEGDGDQGVDVKAVLQAHAKLYQVDVNDLAASYPHILRWIGHKQLTSPLPRTLDELENRLKLTPGARLLH